MKPVLWFRLTALVMLLFAAAHTFGFLTFQPASEEGRAVWKAMNTVRFSQGSSTFSYAEFYIGFGLSITAFQLFSAWLAWTLGSTTSGSTTSASTTPASTPLGSTSRREMTDARTIAWGLAALQLISLVLSVRYFAVAPALLSGLAAILLILAATSTPRLAPNSA